MGLLVCSTTRRNFAVEFPFALPDREILKASFFTSLITVFSKRQSSTSSGEYSKSKLEIFVPKRKIIGKVALVTGLQE